MKKIILALILGLILAALTFTLAQAQTDNCITCHQDMEDEDGPSYKFVRDIHGQEGLSCADCHGGDPSLDDMDDVRESPGYRGAPSRLEVPEFCARCHGDATYMRQHNPAMPTDQLEKYKTSVHGYKLFRQQDEKVANCVSCHGVHDIGSAKMPHSSTHPLNIPKTCGSCHADAEYMAGYGIPTDQLSDYEKSVHGHALLDRKDLGAPACNDCHGNHGAAPPGMSSVTAVCGNCHALEAELFAASPHMEAYAENDFPMCVTCHSNHNIEEPSDALVGIEEPSLCIECHEEGDGTRGLETARGIAFALKRISSSHKEARAALDDAYLKGMRTTDEEFRIKEVEQILIQTRTLVHSYNLDSVLPKAELGIEKADTVIANSAALIDEYYFRRKGLGLATIFITIVVVALFIKIRDIERA